MEVDPEGETDAVEEHDLDQHEAAVGMASGFVEKRHEAKTNIQECRLPSVILTSHSSVVCPLVLSISWAKLIDISSKGVNISSSLIFVFSHVIHPNL